MEYLKLKTYLKKKERELITHIAMIPFNNVHRGHQKETLFLIYLWLIPLSYLLQKKQYLQCMSCVFVKIIFKDVIICKNDITNAVITNNPLQFWKEHFKSSVSYPQYRNVPDKDWDQHGVSLTITIGSFYYLLTIKNKIPAK